MPTVSADSLLRKKTTTFMTSYIDTCKALNCHPLSFIRVRLPNRILEFNADRIKLVDWQPLLKTISEDRSLHLICIKTRQPLSSYLGHLNTENKVQDLKKVPVLFTGYMMGCLVESLMKSLASKSLSVLDLHQIPLDKDTVKELCKGLSKNSSLQHFSLSGTLIGDEGCEEICRAVRDRPNILSLTLINCNLTEKGAFYISKLIKNQEMARFNESWKHTLRYRELDHNRLPGLRRISLNHNPKIGDEGLKYIVEIMMDDLWIKAIDMQDCGISEHSFEKIHNLVTRNVGIMIFDVRDNNIPSDKMEWIFDCLIKNNENDSSEEYYWMEEAVIDDLSTSGSVQSYQTKSRESGNNLIVNGKRKDKSNTSNNITSRCQRASGIAVNQRSVQKRDEPLKKKNNVIVSKKSLDNLSVDIPVGSTSSESSVVPTQQETKTARRSNRVISSPIRLCKSATNNPRVKHRSGNLNGEDSVRKSNVTIRKSGEISNVGSSCSGFVSRKVTRVNGVCSKKEFDGMTPEEIEERMRGLILGDKPVNGFRKVSAQTISVTASGDTAVVRNLSSHLFRGIRSILGPEYAENYFWSNIHGKLLKYSSRNGTNNLLKAKLNGTVSYTDQRYSPSSAKLTQSNSVDSGFVERK